MAPTNVKTVHQTSLLHIESNLNRLGLYNPEKEVATQNLFDKFHEFSMPQNSNPIAALDALKNINNQMEEKETGRTPDTVVHARFVRGPCKINTTINEKPGQGRNHPRGEHAVLQPTPKDGGEALVPTA